MNTYDLEVRRVVTHLRTNYAERTVPTDGMLAKARAILNASKRQTGPPSEATEVVLDELHGLFTWGRLLAPFAYLNPDILALERTRRRHQQAGGAEYDLEILNAPDATEVTEMTTTRLEAEISARLRSDRR